MEFDEEKAKAYLEELKKDKLFDAKLEFGRLLMKPEHEFTEEERMRFKELNDLIMKEVKK